jgi:ABC-type sugar transport system ATPase subunit
LKRRSEQSDALAAAEELGVRAANMDLSIKSLSGGNQQKVLLARWVLAAPRAAIFDEPTRGVDVGAKEGIYEIIEKLAADGLASVVISSELEELVRLCDRVYVIYEGEVAGELAGDEITVDALGAFALGAA